MLVRLADSDKSKLARSSKTATFMTEDEITGNLFLFTMAGFDTTANTLVYAIMALALEPDWQDWIFEGINEVSRRQPDGQYSVSFPLQTRCLALLVCMAFSKFHSQNY